MGAPPIPTEPKKSITLEGKQYEVIREGLADILIPQDPSDANGARGKSQTVFYNPIQQFNRDLSVLVVRAFAEDVSIIRQLRKKREQRKRNEGVHRGKKRKRGPEEQERRSHKTEPPEVKESAKAAGSSNAEASNGSPPAIDYTASVEEHEKLQLDGRSGAETKANGVEGIPTKPKADREKENGDGTSQSQSIRPPSFRILDALSATGLRALRYAKEIPAATSITANDLSASATKSILLNVKHNNLETKVQAVTGDALSHLYEVKSSNRHPDQRVYQVIDLDPYGTAAPFFDAAVQALADGGLLCVTCTDAGVFASAGYLEKTFSQYGGLPFKGPQSHEGGLRLILHAIATSAARYGLAIEPLLSLSIDFYARIFVRVRKSPAEVKFLAGKTMIVYNCDQGCGSWTTQFMAQTKERKDKNGDILHKFSLGQGPSANQLCEHCGFKTHISGRCGVDRCITPTLSRKSLICFPNLTKMYMAQYRDWRACLLWL